MRSRCTQVASAYMVASRLQASAFSRSAAVFSSTTACSQLRGTPSPLTYISASRRGALGLPVAVAFHSFATSPALGVAGVFAAILVSPGTALFAAAVCGFCVGGVCTCGAAFGGAAALARSGFSLGAVAEVLAAAEGLWACGLGCSSSPIALLKGFGSEEAVEVGAGPTPMPIKSSIFVVTTSTRCLLVRVMGTLHCIAPNTAKTSAAAAASHIDCFLLSGVRPSSATGEAVIFRGTAVL